MYSIYSHEALPNPALIGKRGYTPDGSWIRVRGVTLPQLPAKTWVELDQEDPRFRNFYRNNDKQKVGQDIEVHEVPLRYFLPVVNGKESPFAMRGVVMLDHKPTPEEAKKLEQVCLEENTKFRQRTIQFYESQREVAKANGKNLMPDPYVDECYEVLGQKKPYSMEAIEALRDPGAKAAQQFATAMKEILASQKEAPKPVAVR